MSIYPLLMFPKVTNNHLRGSLGSGLLFPDRHKQSRTKRMSLVDSLERELGNYALKIDKLMQLIGIALLYLVDLCGSKQV